MTSYSINLLFINEPQCTESSLHTLLVAIAWRYYVILRNNIWGDFLPVSWLLLGNFLTYILGFSWWFLKTSSWFVTTFSPPELSSLLKIHQEATETPSRSQWDANKTTTISSRSDKICQIVKKWQDLSNRHEYFWNFQKKSWSFPIYQELSGSVKKLFKKSPRRY